MVQGYWQVPLSEDGQQMFTMVTPEGLLNSRIDQPGVRSTIGYFPATIGDWLDGSIDKIVLV